MRVTLIAAIADNMVIGAGNDIPWRLPEDWRHFKQTTMGHHLVMGRRTWDSIGKALPGRTTIVISGGDPELPPGVHLSASLEDAMAMARRSGDSEIFIAGGAQIYRQALPIADRMLLTRVHSEPEGDTLFPGWEATDWSLHGEEFHDADERHSSAYTFQVFERIDR